MKISVLVAGEVRVIQVPAGPTLLEFLRGEDIYVNAACGGRGSCQKCRVRVSDGFLGITAADQRAFSSKEIQEGWRLSCQARPRGNLECLLPSVESTKSPPRLIWKQKQSIVVGSQAPRLVVDLGSTGVVAALCDQENGLLLEAHVLNQQVLLGADVMTRLQYVQGHGNARARELMIQTLRSLFLALENAVPETFARSLEHEIPVAGNSVMMSLLHDWDSSTLAVAPFRPVQLASAESVIDGRYCLRSLDLLGGFVGADALSGALHLELGLKIAGPWALIDVGTNTEIIIKNSEGDYYFSSAPAGPAFEGGNILCGMRAEPGAISKARFQESSWVLETIGGDIARGICGSGLFDIIAESLDHGILHKDGFLPAARIELVDGVSLIANDVREFQLAKAATRTAVEILADRAGAMPPVIYLAGSFAEHIALPSLERVGILPEGGMKHHIGNASLLGLRDWALSDPSLRAEVLARVLDRRKGIELALETDFQERFVQNINFR